MYYPTRSQFAKALRFERLLLQVNSPVNTADVMAMYDRKIIATWNAYFSFGARDFLDLDCLRDHLRRSRQREVKLPRRRKVAMALLGEVVRVQCVKGYKSYCACMFFEKLPWLILRDASAFPHFSCSAN